MPEETDDPPQPPPEPHSVLGNLPPDEMLARGMQTVKMTFGAEGAWQPPTLEEAAQVFRGYEVIKLLGRGGMGAVYQARQIELDRLVAIKLLPLEISVDQNFADRFRREARAMARLNHPNIVSVYDFGATSEGHLYFVMEFVEGANLAEIIHQVGLDGDQVLSIAEQVCAALSYAHEKGIIHRDIKPANVMIDTESHVKVADFGLARVLDSSAADLGRTMTGIVMGTPDYMAPEQMRGMHVDHSADIYSVGVMLYEMLCREVPRGAFAPPSVRGGCDPRLDAIVLKAMQPDPGHRFQSTKEMRREVSAARLALPEPAPAPQEAAGLSPAAKKSKVPLALALAIGVLIAAAVAYHFFQPKPDAAAGAPVGAAQTPGTSLHDSAAQNSALPAATKEAPFVNSLGMKFVPVPRTHVLFGVWDVRVQDYAAYAGAQKVDDSWTNRNRDGVPAGRELNHPVVGVSWENAEAFCQWLTGKEQAIGQLPKGLQYRLPSDEEWSWAVGPPESGTTPAEKGQIHSVDFPWGRDYPPTGKIGNYADETFHAKFPPKENEKGIPMEDRWIEGYTDGYSTTSPVGSFPANAHGLYDMGGNVWQWCEDWYDASHKDRVLRGSSWIVSDRHVLLSAHRGHNVPGYHTDYSGGFRCVLAPAATSVARPAPVAPAGSALAGVTKDAPFVNSLGMEFVPVPIGGGPAAGQQLLFSVWDTRVQDYAVYAGARKVDASWTNRHRDGVPMGREPDHPVAGVSWEDAQAFCQWLTEKEQAEGRLPKAMKYRLPTDEEWSWAAGMPAETGATPAEKSGKNRVDFPWGQGYPPTRKVGNYADEAFHAKFPKDFSNKTIDQPWLRGYDDGYATTSPVGSFPANARGLYDMGGNIWQWCEDWYDAAHTERVLRGTSWGGSDRNALLSSARDHNVPGNRWGNHGFRCVVAGSVH